MHGKHNHTQVANIDAKRRLENTINGTEKKNVVSTIPLLLPILFPKHQHEQM